MKRFAICFFLASALSACGSGVSTTFKNQSDRELEAVELSGSGFKASLGIVAPGQSHTIRVYPSGDSALSVSFVANGQSYSSGPQGYFSGGWMWEVSAKVERDLTVSVETDIWP